MSKKVPFIHVRPQSKHDLHTWGFFLRISSCPGIFPEIKVKGHHEFLWPSLQADWYFHSLAKLRTVHLTEYKGDVPCSSHPRFGGEMFKPCAMGLAKASGITEWYGTLSCPTGERLPLRRSVQHRPW